MGGGLVGDHIRDHTADDHFGVDLGGVADERDGERLPFFAGFLHQGHGFFQVIDHAVHVADIQAAFGAGRIHFHDQANAFVHGDGQGLCAAHAAQTGGEHQLSLQGRPAAFFGQGEAKVS